MIKIRCSSLPAFMACPSCKQEPKTGKCIDQDNVPRREGNASHAALAISLLGKEVDLKAICEVHHVKEGDVGMLLSQGMKQFRTVCADLLGKEPEDVTTEEEGFVVIGGRVKLTGTCDAIIDEIGLDWKSGYRIYEPKWQLNGYKRIHEFEIGVIGWLRDDVVDVYRDLLEDKEFDEALLAQVEKIGKEEVFGEHCFGCKRQHECETYRTHIRCNLSVFVGDAAHPLLDLRKQESDGEEQEMIRTQALVELKPRVALLEKHIVKYKALLKAAVAEAGPQDMGDGTELAIIDKDRTKIDAKKAFKLGSKYLGKAEYLALLEVSKGKLVDAVKDKAEQGQKAKRAREFLKDLDAEGAMSKTSYSEMRVRRITA